MHRTRPLPRGSGAIGGWLGGGLFVVVGCLVMYAMSSRGLRDASMAVWPTAAGVVVSARLDEHPESEELAEGADGPTTAPAWAPVVTYDYVVAGRSYRGAAYSNVHRCWKDRRQAERVLEGLSPGGAVAVRYDPAAPTDACLEVAPRRLLWLGFLVGMGLTVLGLRSWYLTWREARKRRRRSGLPLRLT